MDEMTSEELMRRIEMLEFEIGKVKRAIIAASEGKSFDEVMSEEFMTEKADMDSCRSWLSNMVEHLLKRKYSDAKECNQKWEHEIMVFQREIVDATRYGQKRKDTNLINKLTDELQECYEAGYKKYNKDSKRYSDLPDISKIIPEECPWELEDLLTWELVELLEALPDLEV